MRVKYIPFFTENMEQQAKFFSEKLKFSILGKTSLFEHSNCCLVYNKQSDIWVAICEKKYNGVNKNVLILSTDDCIKDYHQLLSEGVIFTRQPDYLPAGLTAEFTDDFNNRYVLLEERNYNEDL